MRTDRGRTRFTEGVGSLWPFTRESSFASALSEIRSVLAIVRLTGSSKVMFLLPFGLSIPAFGGRMKFTDFLG